MMNDTVLVENNTVVQRWVEKPLLEVKAERQDDAGLHEVKTGTVFPGMLFKSNKFIDPPPSTNPADYPLNRIQFKFMVRKLGLDRAIQTAIDGMPEKTEAERDAKIMAQVLIEEGQTFHRANPVIENLLSSAPKKSINAAWLAAKEVG